ncbi:hypothetical protein FSB73_03295 [Arachidicoccus ginsenosidivorans]|uniref:Right handed beta helix domain-containing protein n=1 Tax=Arachidicoccus ginsenosidivorans TaxID=496057 RepID=A0A5B8VGW5_9BACT|nr:hypothetical protein FSB73_03295 [Arachidicoccus ginsenosidivorans]
MDHVTIKNNTATDGGGGIDYTNASPSLRNVLISGNTADLGGGIRSTSGSVTLTNVSVTGNTANSGGGIYLGGVILVITVSYGETVHPTQMRCMWMTHSMAAWSCIIAYTEVDK